MEIVEFEIWMNVLIMLGKVYWSPNEGDWQFNDYPSVNEDTH